MNVASDMSSAKEGAVRGPGILRIVHCLPRAPHWDKGPRTTRPPPETSDDSESGEDPELNPNYKLGSETVFPRTLVVEDGLFELYAKAVEPVPARGRGVVPPDL